MCQIHSSFRSYFYAAYLLEDDTENIVPTTLWVMPSVFSVMESKEPSYKEWQSPAMISKEDNEEKWHDCSEKDKINLAIAIYWGGSDRARCVFLLRSACWSHLASEKPH